MLTDGLSSSKGASTRTGNGLRNDQTSVADRCEVLQLSAVGLR